MRWRGIWAGAETGRSDLYRGPVALDSSGCFRLETFPEHHTVIWPFGSHVVERGGWWSWMTRVTGRYWVVGEVVR